MPTRRNRFRKSTLKTLKKMWERSREYGRGRNGFHEYLKTVDNLYTELRKTRGRAKKVRTKIIKWEKLKRIGKNSHTIYVIIMASSGEDKRTQSRWAQALRYARRWRKKRDHLTLTEFFKKNGGVAGCAQKFSTKENPKL
jgi:hypothetical protein